MLLVIQATAAHWVMLREQSAGEPLGLVLRAPAANPHTLFGKPIAHDQNSVQRVLRKQGMQ